jgi:PAS domain S-box-containing protein
MSITLSSTLPWQIDSFLADLPVPLCRIDKLGRITEVNAAWTGSGHCFAALGVGSSCLIQLPVAAMRAISEAWAVPETAPSVINVALDRGARLVISTDPDGARLALLAPPVAEPAATVLDVEMAVRRSARLDATLRALPDNLFEFDSEGRFINFHAGGRRPPAISPSLFIGRTLEEAMPPEVAAAGRRAIADVDRTGRSDGIVYRLDAKGEELWFELAAARLDLGPQEKPGYVFLSREVTERVTAQREANRQKSLLAGLFNLSSIGICLVEKGSGLVQDVNPALLDVLGYARQDLVGTDMRLLVPPEHMANIAGLNDEMEAKGSFEPIEIAMFHKSGRVVPVRASGALVVDHSGKELVWSCIEDLTAQRQRESKLQAAEQAAITAKLQLWTAVESMSDGFALYDAEDRLVLSNQSYRKLYANIDRADGPGMLFEAKIRTGIALGLFTDAVGREEEFARERMANHLAPSGEFVMRMTNGQVVRVLERRTPDGGVVGLHVPVTDLHNARERAQIASQLKTSFLANMSHEIRNPLGGILGAAEVLGTALTGPEERRLLRSIQQSGETLLVILNDMLDITKIEAGKLNLENRAFRPSELLEPVENLYALRAKDKNLAFRCETEGDLNAWRNGDSHRITQILHNLLSNAIKFSEKGSVVLSVCALANGPLRLSVQDTGIGMSEQVQSRIFRPFEQADVGIARRFGGTGLGMSIVGRLLEMMGGTIETHSTLGVGTTMIVTLPAPLCEAPSGSEAVAALTPDMGIPQSERLDGLRILVADDSEINRTILSAFLTALGAQPTLAVSGEDAIAQWIPFAYDLICLDISMPGIDGVETIEHLRARAIALGAPFPPAIAITGNVLPADTDRYSGAGFAAHLPKPFRRNELAASIRRAMNIGPNI